MIVEIRQSDLGNTDFVRLAQAFYEGSGLPGTFKQESFINTWTKFLALKIGVIYVWVIDDRICGGIGGLINPDPYDGEIVAQELFWFVEPNAGFKAALKLYECLESWAIEQKAKRLNMACVCNQHMASLRKFYEKRGFKPVDISYFKNLS